MEIKEKFLKLIIKLITLIGSVFLKENNIVLIANGLKNFDGNSKYFYNYLKENNDENDDIEFYWITNSIDEYKKLINNKINVLYCYSIKGIITIIKAKFYVITISVDDIVPGIFVSNRKIVIQTWHGIPIKTLGNKANKYYSKKEILKQKKRCFNNKNTYVISSSRYIEKIFTDCFDVKSYRYIQIGYPRNDIFIKKNKQELKNKLLNSDNQFLKVLLYCPTWREKSQFELFPFNDGNLNKFNDFLFKNKYILFLKLHPLHDKKNILDKEYSNIKIINKDCILDTQELLYISDILLTDYSSIYFDFILMDKPVIFIPYDYDNYMDNRDFLYDYHENTPGPKINNYTQLIESINQINNIQYKEARMKTNVKFNEFNTFNSCKKMKDFIITHKGD